jgi:hypothetical protein
MAFDKGFKKKTSRRPDPNSRPQLLYPAVPENYDGWPDKTAQPVNFTGIRIPGTTSIPKVPVLRPPARVAPPRQPSLQAKSVGIGKPAFTPSGGNTQLSTKIGAPASTFAKPPASGAPRTLTKSLGIAATPRPKNPVYTPAYTLKDEFGKVKDLPSNTPLPTKTAAQKPLFGKLQAKPLLNVPQRKKYIGPQLQTEPLGATMPNQSTGGGITGGYGSN